MKIKEVSASVSGVVPIAKYENLRPFYSITAEVGERESIDEVLTKLKSTLRMHFDLEVNRAKADLLEKQYSSLRFYEEDGMKYVSVTAVLNWDKDWKISEDELRQYGCRGTIIHKLVYTYLESGTWIDPEALPELKEACAVVLGGSLGLHWSDCSYQTFFEKHRDKIKIESTEKRVVNKERLYAGRYDILGEWEGSRAIMDIKSGSGDMRQLAAYAVCCKDIDKLVILPVGRTDNKSGYMKPIISENIQTEYKAFLKARARFRERFGV